MKSSTHIDIPPVAEGETYIGAIGDKNGDVYHLILMAVDHDDSNHADAMAWAQSIGGDLPTKVEIAMLFDVAKDQFQPDWYWTNQTYVVPSNPENTAYAWYQNFSYGGQGNGRKGCSGRARAVRRLPI